MLPTRQDRRTAFCKAALPPPITRRIFSIPTVLNEYETRYENGQPAPQTMVVANIEAGPTKEEKVNALAESMQAAVQEVLGEDKKLTLVFHDNGLDRIAIGGVTIATKMQKK